MAIRAGDRVTCIKGSNGPDSVEGETYTVERVLTINGIDGLVFPCHPYFEDKTTIVVGVRADRYAKETV